MRASLDPSLDALTEAAIGAAFDVSRILGHGFLESVYKNALIEELECRGIPVVKERSYPVLYRDKQVGLYVADIVVADRVILELKAVPALAQTHRAQLLNYLNASGLPIGLLMNFGTPKVEIRRVIR